MWVLAKCDPCGWQATQYVAAESPKTRTEDPRAAQKFDTMQAARAVKKAFYIERHFIPRRIPEWV